MLNLTKIISSLSSNKGNSSNLAILGSSGAGKTTLIRFLETEKPVPDTQGSTIGIDYRSEPVKIQNVEFSLIDLGGQQVYQEAFWSLAVSTCDAIIYVFDGTIHPESENFPTILNQFNYMLNLVAEEVPLLILINKQDLSNCLTPEQYADSIGLSALRNRSIIVLPSSAKYGEGLLTAFLWLIEKLSKYK